MTRSRLRRLSAFLGLDARAAAVPPGERSLPGVIERVVRLIFFVTGYGHCVLFPYIATRCAVTGRLPPTDDVMLLGALFLLFVWTLPIATAGPDR